MLAWLVRAALTQRVLVLAMAALLVVLGLRASGNVPLDVFPEFAPPIVEVQTEAPGLSTEEVESLITVPIEIAVNGVPDLATVRSKSVLGLSSVTILFKRGTDVIRARQLVQERVGQVQARLPAAARPPVMLPPLSSTSRAMKIGISSTKLDQMQLSELARWTIRPRLMAVPGVANVAIWGLRDRQLQVLVDPDRLRAAGVTLADVRAATSDAVLVGGGGFVDTPNQRFAVRQSSAIQSAADLSQAIVKQSGEAAVRIGDVARVVDGFAAPIGNAIIDDGPGLMLIVEKQPTGNTLQLTRDVEKAIAELKPGLKDVKVDTTIFRPATFIERSIDNLSRALMIGCLLVAVVLFVFTRDWRQAVISLTADDGLAGVAAAIARREAARTTASLDFLLVDRSGRTVAGRLDALVPASPGYVELLAYRRDGEARLAQSLTTLLPDARPHWCVDGQSAPGVERCGARPAHPADPAAQSAR
jgi:Cu/Ag efflux pump CusA